MQHEDVGSGGRDAFDDADAESVAVLSAERCWRLLDDRGLGRLVVNVHEVIDVYPLHYAVLERENTRAEAARVPVLISAPRTVYVAIRPDTISGRWFAHRAANDEADVPSPWRADERRST